MPALMINGSATDFDVPDDMPLLWVLRDVAGLTGTKFGCGVSLCGACTVHVDGHAVRSCVTPVSAVAGLGARCLEATAFWRGVGPTHNVCVVESFVDELASAARQDPMAYRRALLGKSPRLLRVLNLVAEKSGWGQPLKAIAGRRVGRGVSAQFAFGS